MTNQQKLKKLYSILEEVEVYERSIGKLEFDMECCAPKDGIAQAGEDMAVLSKQHYKLTHSKVFQRLVVELHENGEGLTDIQKTLVEHLYDDYKKTKNISPELSYEMNLATNRAYGDWLAAKKANDFSLFAPTFEKVIALTRQCIDLRDEKAESYYDNCLDDFEKGGSAEQLDRFFAAVKERTVPLIRRILTEGKPIRRDFMSRPVSVDKQEKCSRYLLELEGLRKDSLVLMTTEHPFTTQFGPKDVRVTTHYYEENFISSIFSTLHEGGHALFMQNEPAELWTNHTANRMSNAMHETISRFYENILGRSEAFIEYFYPKLNEFADNAFADITPRELCAAVNASEPGLIRMESDELCYCLHILVRYELEKAFVNGEISVSEIPALWNAKYKEYLGVDVPDDARGCLQDVHWTMSYGYFPSYALGNAYGAQILRRMERDFDVFAAVRAGELWRVRDWMTEHVFTKASLLTPDEWIRDITGESLNPAYYLDYLEEKYTRLYGLA